ncbi:MAG: C4-dicarboxylate ABC transporter [Vicinamibacteria bacterium]|nr:C4-dicarboxylate ABC transporter [Vicinamibacteria bacterium]
MTPAVLSLLALVVALGVSMTSRINVGWLAIALAWLIGGYGAGMRPDAVMAGFPVSLFLTLAGVTLLFAIAEVNGTLGALAGGVIRLARGNARAMPVLFFILACALSSIGPGAIATVALLAPLAMTMGDRVRVPPLLTALMIANGANAGNLSPFSSVGVIANGAMARAGLVGHEGPVWFANFAAHVIVGGAAYAWLGRRGAIPVESSTPVATAHPDGSLTGRQRFTLAVVTAWIVGVLVFNVSLGLSAFAASAILLVANAADDVVSVRRVPWGIIMMVSGVSVLIAVLEKTGGMDLFTALLARTASPASVNGTIAFVTGAISTYSSTSGVVLPAFLPTVPKLVASLGGGDPLAIALSINVGSSLVDVSPLSTLGALCVAAVPDPAASRRLFQSLLAWGLSMTLVGALLCQIFAGWVAGV